MKKWIALLCLLLVVGFTGCNNSVEVLIKEKVSAPSTLEQNNALIETEYRGETFYGFTVVRFEVVEQLEKDLDGCGQNEMIALIRTYDEHDQCSFALRVVKGTEVYDTEALYSSDSSLWIEDLTGDGIPEIYTSGDMMSTDYVTYGWKLTESGLQSLSTKLDGQLTSGRIASIDNGVVTIENCQNVLGSWFGSRPYVASTVHGIEPQNSSVWENDVAAEKRYLKLIEPLPVVIDGVALLLPVGTDFFPTAFDGDCTVWFETSLDLKGLLHVSEYGWSEADPYAMWYIDGKAESYYFGVLPYAG